jgi:thioredoxin-related protein
MEFIIVKSTNSRKTENRAIIGGRQMRCNSVFNGKSQHCEKEATHQVKCLLFVFGNEEGYYCDEHAKRFIGEEDFQVIKL